MSLSETAAGVLRFVRSFEDTLDERQRSALRLPFDPSMMRTWSNFPQQVLGRHGRVGLSTAGLHDEQWDALVALLRCATGSEPGLGWDRIRQHLETDDYLRAHGGRYGYGRDQFVVAVLGEPDEDGPWQLQFGGHHLALVHTYRDGRLIGATPSFRGIEPYTPIEWHGEQVEAERVPRRAFGALLGSLDDDQLHRARLPERLDDIRLGPGADWRFPTTREGLSAGELSAAQQDLLMAAVASYVDDVADADAVRIMQRYRAELADTRLAFAGSPALDAVGDYVRIDGPAVWIELSMHEGIVLSGPHPHAVWRDRTTDYGGHEGEA